MPALSQSSLLELVPYIARRSMTSIQLELLLLLLSCHGISFLRALSGLHAMRLQVYRQR
jgi:hypothetical protein